MSKNLKFMSLVMTMLLCLTASTFGQQTTGNIEGTIRDPQGAVVPGASVTVEGVTVGFNRTVQANDEGLFRVQQIPPGIYRVSVAAVSGFSAATVENITVVTEKTTMADVTVGLTQNVTTVDVTSDPSGVVVDPTDNKIQTNVTSQLIERLPRTESFSSLLRTSPATRSEPLSGQFQVDGASGSENSFIIDGQEVTNFRTGTLNSNNNVPTSLVQEIQIKTSGFEAEHGGASGGVVVVNTKGGTDTWRGEFGAQFITSGLQAGPRAVDQVFRSGTTQTVYSILQPRDDYVNFFPTATIGGPIVKSRLWFLGSYTPQIYETSRRTTYYGSNPTNLTVNPNFSPEEYRARTKYEYAFGRVDANITNNLRAFSSFLWNPQINDGILTLNAIAVGGTPSTVPLGGTTYRGAAYNAQRGGRVNANTFNTQVVWTPTSKAVVALRYGFGFLNEKGTTAYGIPNETRINCSTAGDPVFYAQYNTGCTYGFLNFSSNTVTNYDVSKRHTFNADLSYLVNDFGGRHNFKGGYEYGTVFNDVNTGYVNTGRIDFYYGLTLEDLGISGECDLVNCIGVGNFYRFGTIGTAENKYQALYIQDKWQPFSRLTLNLGVRAETENLPAFNVGDEEVGEPINFGWGDKITPRLGFAFDVFGDGKSRLFGSFGTFTDRIRFATARGSFGGDFFRDDYFPILASHPEYTYYTPARILGNFTDPVGGGIPSQAGGLSVQQYDLRIPSNLPPEIYASLGLPLGAVDPNLKPFTQREITVGFERELSDIFVLTTRFTRKDLLHVVEDQANIGLFESESYIIGNVGEGLAFDVREAAGYVKQTKAQREYTAFEISLNKRLSNNYFFNVNYTFSKLYGNYSGLASSDEVTAGVGRTDPGASRYFDYIINGFTAYGDPDNGRLATDRPHQFKAYGGYTFNWWNNGSNETDFNFFTTIMSGTPQTTFVDIGHTSLVLEGRGNLGRTEMFTQTDLGLTHRYRFGTDNRFTLAFDINALNAFNENNVTSLYTTRYLIANAISIGQIDPAFNPATSTPTVALNRVLNGQIGAQLQALETRAGNINTLFGTPSGYQSPRQIRFGFRLLF